jgi:CO/xanthine dehydrogenase Mo-binding subunit
MHNDRRQFLQTAGALVVSFSLARPALAAIAPGTVTPAKTVDKEALDAWLAIGRDNRITVYSGKVDLGTGTRTALAQIAAEELEVAFERIEMVMGDTGTTPDQWLTGANLTIAQGGSELRRAAASARAALVERASKRLGIPVVELIVDDGVVRSKGDPSRRAAYGELIGEGFELKVDPKAPLRKPADYRVVGHSIPRVDIPGKVTGEWTYVHDFRLPGMLHARVIRSPIFGAGVASVDDRAARAVSGFVQTVRKGNFLAVVAKNEWSAIKAARALKVEWTEGTRLPEKESVFQTWRARPVAKVEATQKAGDAPAALAQSTKTVKASYEFPVQTHASIGPSCAVAQFKDGKLTVWSASQATHSMQTELASLTGLAPAAIRLVYLEGSGCYGRNGHEDATADAAVIAQMIGQPVRVQWMRDDETSRAPKSPPRAIDFEAGLDAQGNITAWNADFWIALNHIAAFKPLDFPLLAATDVGQKKPGNWVGFLFQNAGMGYAVPNIRVDTHHVAETFFRSSHLRSPGRIENTFANEGFMDELAHAAGADPAEFRLRNLKDARAEAVIRAAMKLSGWQSRVGTNAGAATGNLVRGRGISYVRYNNAITYVAAVAEVEVNRDTGAVRVVRLCLGHDCGQMVNPDGVANQVQGGALQTVSRTLIEQVQWTPERVTSIDWASYPIARFTDMPRVEIELIDRPGEPSWGVGEPTATVIPGAIANAIFDATGARMRSVPFTPEKVKAALATVSRA